MMVQKTLKLAEGRKVPLEDGRDWPAEGATVDVTLYIRRRLADGDLVEVEPPAVEPAPVASHPPEAEEPQATETIKSNTGRKGRSTGE